MAAPEVLANNPSHGGVLYYVVKVPKEDDSTESGWDNPFRPGGDLSREADQIVELIKGGKPITPTPGSQAPPLPSGDDSLDLNHTVDGLDGVSPKKITSALTTAPPSQSKTNGTTDKAVAPGQVDVQRSTIKAEADGVQVEHITIKKKKGCHCCVIS
ncbi:hypothetical protein HUJ04_008875 [Dendroctonus ponderosae]|nr:hypothetical protein HUJ04_008875 [Dendroctonus ponderosae]KAH1008831.1 hypothetical protein HUJ05_009349 [Dendroctonus ponderosae]KAH1008832.1 hypothetical protein HUJ05_009349 [Dendroctonus ponderosae]KAH1008833.1 hypothetical protein HUJ05_009349 [Dendroctonus ponderosae]KAH1008834.1 hypothetical protein HUJ05_009349 [Dendroctonus ponderosae]